MNLSKSWCICAVLIGTVPNIAVAQQPGPSGLTGPTASELRISAEGLLAPPPTAQPQPLPPGEPAAPVGMTLAELEETALQCNPSVAAAAHRVQAARGRSIQAGLYPNPVAGYVGAEIGNEGQSGQQGGFLAQEIVTAGKLRLARNAAQQQVNRAECELQSQYQRVLTDVRRGFYDALLAQQAVELTEQLLRLAEEGLRSSESLMNAQEVARSDVLLARIEAESARVLLEKAKNRHASAWRNLAAVVGNPNLQPAPLMGEVWDNLPQLAWEDACNRLLAESPQLAAAQAEVARAQAAVARECAKRVPNIDLETAVQYDNATKYTWATVQAGIPVPIFNRNQGNIIRSQAELAAAQREVQRVRLELQQKLAAVFEQYASSRYQAEKFNREILLHARESLDLAAKGYREGEYNYLFLLTAQRTYFQTNLAYLDSVRELRSAAAAIEGYLLSGSLRKGESD